ncbi:hypothetical protein CSUI_010900 [Cystoisospora suis]|uniref:Transmembrane protein n=1 Tax=Cystoisospora suis TaxID=483139 RepID=A0A2C6KF47_9APIC|nr:hypothetical protein CSUI_010900 [Cystoisospora suis]
MAQVSQSFSGLFPVVRGGHRRCLLVLVLLGLVFALSVAQASSSSEGVKQQVQELSDDYASEDGAEDNSQAVSSVITRNSRVAAKSSGSLARKAALLLFAVAGVALAVVRREDIMKLFAKEEVEAPGAPKSPEKKQAAKLSKKKMVVVSTALVTAAVAAGAIYYQMSGAQEAVEDILPSVPKDEATARLFEHILPQVAEAPSLPESLKAYIPSDLFSVVPTDRTTQAIVTLAAAAVGLHILLVGPVRDAVKLNKLNNLLMEYEAAAPALPEAEVPAPVRAAQEEKAALEDKKARKWMVGKMLDVVASMYAGIYAKLSRSEPALA